MDAALVGHPVPDMVDDLARDVAPIHPVLGRPSRAHRIINLEATAPSARLDWLIERTWCPLRPGRCGWAGLRAAGLGSDLTTDEAWEIVTSFGALHFANAPMLRWVGYGLGWSPSISTSTGRSRSSSSVGPVSRTAAMSTEVFLSRNGVPHPSPGRAGAGTMVRSGDVVLQFDAGRGTVLRMADLEVRPHELSALFLTHVHSDHVVDVADVAMTRWLEDQLAFCGPLPIVTATGTTEPFLEALFDPFAEDIAPRIGHVQGRAPEIAVPHSPRPRPRRWCGPVRTEISR